MREFTWAKLDKEMCLYWTESPGRSGVIAQETGSNS